MLTFQEDERFYHKLQGLYTRAAGARDWGWEPLYEDRYLRCGLLWFGPGGRLPLHDHQDMLGILIGLTGELEVERYDLPPSPPREGHVLLTGGTRTVLRRDDISVVDGPRGNIHGLRNATPHPTFVLDALWHGGRRVQRHLFFPTGSRALERLPAMKLRECRVRDLGRHMPEITPLRAVAGDV
jgi:hypothetical protein